MTTAKVYALLVGIDAYAYPTVPPLRGCRNDIQAIHEYLQERAQDSSAFDLHALVLEDGQATYQATVDGFREHLGQAGSDDAVLFYYSGHGAQRPTAPEHLALEPDGRDETLVLYDSRDPGKRDLADKELAELIRQVADKAGHVCVVLDCCHSGSGTRNLYEDGLTVRQAPFDDRPPLAPTFPQQHAADSRQPVTSRASGSGWAELQYGKHVLLAACLSSETAKEVDVDGKHRGAFSAALLGALESVGQFATYRDLIKRASTNVLSLVKRQTPQLEVVGGASFEEGFLGGKLPAKGSYFTLFHHPDHGWVIDGGAVHHVRMNSDVDTTTLAVFALDREPGTWTDLSASLGTATVTRVMPHLSAVSVAFPPETAPDPALTYRAVVTSQPVSALGVWIRDSDGGAGAEFLRAAIENARGAGEASLFVREVKSEAEASFRVSAENGTFTLARLSAEPHVNRLVSEIEGLTEASAREVVARLEHMARWQLTMNLENPTSRLAGSVTMEAFLVTGPPLTPNPTDVRPDPVAPVNELHLRYRDDDPGKAPEFKIRLKNKSGEKLYCALLYLDESYEITNELLQGKWLDKGEEVWALDDQPIQSLVQDDWYTQGITEVHDRVKLIVSTDEFDSTLMTQPELDVRAARLHKGRDEDPRRQGSWDRSLAWLMRSAGSRKLGRSHFADWLVADLRITVVRPLAGQPLPQAGASVALTPNVTLDGHPSLRGQASLTSIPQAARDLNSPALPPALALVQEPDIWQPWSFSTSRNGEAALAALELHSIENPEAVTREQPLTLRVTGMSLEKGQHVLATGWDSETQMYLPLGVGRNEAAEKGGGVTVNLERLPSPINERSLVSAVRILFTKFVATKFGLEYPYPLLRAVKLQDGRLSFSEPHGVTDLVTKADRILLFVHGIIGDSESLARSLTSPLLNLARPYDLVLAFDYESLNDGIAKNAADLKAAMEKVGLTAGHGKTLHVVAHSMGGLVTRYFIEQLGGQQVVGKLVMLGTPNGGSPWTSVQAWASTAVAAGLNLLGTTAWPVTAITGLLGLIEKVDQNLDEMQPGSGILTSLSATADPGVPYVLIVGDALLDAQKRPLLEKLARKLGTETIFVGQQNDIAVSVASAMNLPAERHPAPVKVEPINCDHMSYFRTTVGLEALRNALEPPVPQPAQAEAGYPSNSY
ncbi:hypothetical protein CBQ26_15145 [Deinococcus indicus]|uniref:Uncharacterized protein n=1 Tax=Deinococcus indicus TaxID=223556 RepID=A0A246BIE5_9DEIO|nr:caspase family protein [Deinococcus indicus]OWL94628.1 hypothetical protein CBQ26_15145 [Deinococcus indicus]